MATRKPIPPDGFFYRDSDHVYALNGERMTGVTTILGGVGDKSNLIQWAANLASAGALAVAPEMDVEAFNTAVKGHRKIDTRAANELDKLFPQFKTARTSHIRVRDTAGDAGTEAHLICEMYERGMPMAKADCTEEGWRRSQEYINWYKGNIAKTHFVERPLFSASLFVGGTPDGGFQFNDGRNYINDKKFKPYIYDPSAFWQMGAYRMMLEEMAEDTATHVRLEWKDGTVEEYASPKEYLGSFGGVAWEGAVIVRVGETDFETMFCDTYEDDKKGFLAALEIYRQMGAFKNRVQNITQ